MATKLCRMVTYLDEFLSIKLHYRFKFQSVYDHHVLQDGNLPWWAPTHKFKKRYDHVILQNLVINWNHYISTTTVPIATKFGRIVTYLEGLLSIKSYKALISWPWKVTWQTKIIIYSLPEYLWPPNLAVWLLNLMSSYLYVIWPFDDGVWPDHVTN